jgi:hypothetical protein
MANLEGEEIVSSENPMSTVLEANFLRLNLANKLHLWREYAQADKAQYHALQTPYEPKPIATMASLDVDMISNQKPFIIGYGSPNVTPLRDASEAGVFVSAGIAELGGQLHSSSPSRPPRPIFNNLRGRSNARFGHRLTHSGTIFLF